MNLNHFRDLPKDLFKRKIYLKVPMDLLRKINVTSITSRSCASLDVVEKRTCIKVYISIVTLTVLQTIPKRLFSTTFKADRVHKISTLCSTSQTPLTTPNNTASPNSICFMPLSPSTAINRIIVATEKTHPQKMPISLQFLGYQQVQSPGEQHVSINTICY